MLYTAAAPQDFSCAKAARITDKSIYPIVMCFGPTKAMI